jgi:hypothetical protein
MSRRDPSPETPVRRSLAERRRRERRVLAAGLAASVVAHVLAIGLVGGWLAPEPEAAPPAVPVIVEPPRGMRVVEVTPVVEPAPAAPVPEAREERTLPEREAPVAVVDAPSDSLPADDLTAADRLAVRITDPRLWRPMVLLPREPTIDDVEARVGAAVELLSDSALAEAEAAVRARDWTVKDASGGRWGISPGKLHLGKLTLPLPLYMPVDMEAVAAEQQWYELETQLDRARILESFEDRVRAVRERREQERSEARKGENGGR